MKRFFIIFSILATVTMMNTGCFLFSSAPSSSSEPAPAPAKPTEDYAPKNIRSGSYISFTRPNGVTIKIVFQTNSVADIAASSATDGRINAGYYRYDGFNMASMTYNYQPNGGMSAQYKVELNFLHASGGTVTFLDTNETATFNYRP